MVLLGGVVLVNLACALESLFKRAKFLHVALDVFLAGGFRQLREGNDFLQEVVRADNWEDVQVLVVGCWDPVAIAPSLEGDWAWRSAGELMFVFLSETVDCEAAKVAVLVDELLLLLAVEDELGDVELDAGKVLRVLGVVLGTMKEATDACYFVAGDFGSLLRGGAGWRRWSWHADVGVRVNAGKIDEVGAVHGSLLGCWLHGWCDYGCGGGDEWMNSERSRRRAAVGAGRGALLFSVGVVQWRQRGRAWLRWLQSLLRRLRREARVAGAFPEI